MFEGNVYINAAFPTLKMLKIVLTIVVSTASCELLFSSLRKKEQNLYLP